MQMFAWSLKNSFSLKSVLRALAIWGALLFWGHGVFGQNINQNAGSTILGNVLWTFDDYELGDAPDNWQTGIEQSPSDPGIWQVVPADDQASFNQVLAMANPSDGGLFGLFGRAFNLVWLEGSLFHNGEIEVQFRAVAGENNQGGGIVWRLQDKSNYYLARFDPLESSFVIYFVRNGSRQELATTHVRLSEHDWHSMKIVQRGNEFEGYLNGQKLLNGSSNLFRKAGAIGLWTKGDAVTWFDNLIMRPAD